MPRRVWIIDKKDQLEQKDYDDATPNGCPEIVNGIPPVLIGVITEDLLPCAYEEQPPPPPEPIPPFEPPLGTSVPEKVSYIEQFLKMLYG